MRSAIFSPARSSSCTSGPHPSDHSTLDADALPAIIAAIRARGYTFVTLPSFF